MTFDITQILSEFDFLKKMSPVDFIREYNIQFLFVDQFTLSCQLPSLSYETTLLNSF